MQLSIDNLQSPSLTKAQLATDLVDHLGLNKREAMDMVDAFFEVIAQSVIEGEEVKLTGFGNFQVRSKVARPGRNPRTGMSAAIPARRVVTFHPGALLKHEIASNVILRMHCG